MSDMRDLMEDAFAWFRGERQLDEASEIDKEVVHQKAMKKAKLAFGDDFDEKKVKGMVDKAISMAKDTEDAVGIVLGFFDEK